MRFVLLGALCAIGASTWGGLQTARAQENAPELSGVQILEKSALAYTNLESYHGTTAIIAVIEMGEDKMVQTSRAEIRFSRAGAVSKLRVEGLDSLGSPFSIVSDGKQTWQVHKVLNGGAVQDAPSVERAVAGMTGIAMHAPTLVPAALLKLKWGFPFVKMENARLIATEDLDGERCYKVVVDNVASKRTFWVGNRDFLLRQMKDERDEDHMTNLMAKAPKLPAKLQAEIDAAKAPSIKSMRLLHVFAISSVDKPIEDEMFHKPQSLTPEPEPEAKPVQ